jgi:putative Mn2+ efflux pump MntP
MIIESRRPADEDSCPLVKLTFNALIVQAVATSIDALSVGFKIVEYNVLEAFISDLIIALVTFVICFAGVILGKKTGTLLSGKANILGGAILIIIGTQILLDSIM